MKPFYYHSSLSLGDIPAKLVDMNATLHYANIDRRGRLFIFPDLSRHYLLETAIESGGTLIRVTPKTSVFWCLVEALLYVVLLAAAIQGFMTTGTYFASIAFVGLAALFLIVSILIRRKTQRLLHSVFTDYLDAEPMP